MPSRGRWPAGIHRRIAARWTSSASPLALRALLLCSAGTWLAGRTLLQPTPAAIGLAPPEPPRAVATPTGGRRDALAAGVAAAAAGLSLGPGDEALAFQAADLGVGGEASGGGLTLPDIQRDDATLKESLYYISRVQEATAQQERLVSTGKFKDMQRNSIKMALNMMIDNYKLGDQIVKASGYVPQDKIQKASAKGNEAIETLELAKEYFNKDLKVAALTNDQRTFLVNAMQTTRKQLDGFLTFMPSDIVNAARKQVEDENAENMKEFAGEGGTIINPIQLPWKKAT